MTGSVSPETDSSGEAPAFDTSVAHSARVYDYWLGGKDNFAADRAAGEQVIEVRPAIRTDVQANRAFLGPAVRYLAGEAGIRQFLDIGTGLPSADNTHEVAQSVAPEARVVYADNDPIVLVHARALLTSTPEGVTAYLDADLRDPATILAQAADTLDLTQPVAIMLVAVLHHIPDADDPYGVVGRLRDAVASGSYLVVSPPANDIQTEKVPEVARRYNASVVTGQTRRTGDEVTAFFGDWDILEPGVTPDRALAARRPDGSQRADPHVGRRSKQAVGLPPRTARRRLRPAERGRVLGERPARPRLNSHHDHRAIQDLAGVLRVLAPEQLPVRSVLGAPAFDQRHTVGPHPPQRRPVVGVLIGKQADPRVLADVAEPPQLNRRLRLVVDAGHDTAGAIDGKRARHHMRPAIAPGSSQAQHRRPGKPIAGFGRVQAHVDQSFATAASCRSRAVRLTNNAIVDEQIAGW